MVVLQLEQQPILVQAIFSGELEEVRTALQYKQDVNCQDCEKRSPLHAASFKGDANVAALLLSYGARVNTKDSRWITPLHRACCCGSADLVSLLLQHQADTTARDKHWQTPLHIAAANNAYDCIAQLLESVPNPNVTDRMGRTALHHAAVNGHNDVVELLLSRGCIVNACDKKDRRPLHCASHMGHVDTIEILVRSGADINAKDRNQYSPLHVAAASGMISACRTLLNSGAQVDIRNAYGNTPLHIACLNGHLLVCQTLLSFGADFELVNYRGQTPLHIAAASTHGVDCLNYLVDQKADINKQSNDGRSPLHMTAIHGRFTRSKTLMDNGAVVDCVDKNGCTALHIAAQYGHDLLANTLLMYGADPFKRGYCGRTPLHMTCLSGYVECCRKFLQVGVDLNAQDDSGKTPTHCAAYKGSVDCLDLLVSSGANFQLVDNIGRIPLHYASSQGHYPCVFTLVGMGSPVNLCDSEGCSPLHLAAAYDTKGECVEYLLRHKADPKLKNVKSFTPVHYAVAGSNFAGLGFLLSAVGNNYLMHGPDMPLTTPLHLAARNGNQDILRLLLSYFHDTNIRTEHGSSALLLAARAGHAHCVQLLLRFGARVSITDTIYNMSPVHHSAQNGHMHCLALLLDNTEDKNIIDLPDSLQRTALMLAVSGGHTESVNTLLKSGANPNITDADQHSALFRAVVKGEHNIVQLLIANGADVIKSDVNGKTVLHLAAACGHLNSMKILLKHMEPSEAGLLDNQGCSALHWACYNGNPSCIMFLLEKNIFKSLEGNSFSSVHCATFAGAERCIELLCNHFGDDIVKLKDARNRTPLHIAALHGHVDCAKFLLEHKAEIECKDSDGRTPLVAAAQNGQSQIIDLLINYKADMTSYDNNGNTALHLACLKCHSHTALLLLENINDIDIVNMVNNDRKTALHLAARNGLVSVTKQLIKKGSSVLAVDANGMTPALCCAPNNSVAQCLALILTNYSAVCSHQNSDTKEKFALGPPPKTLVPPSPFKPRKKLKIFNNRGCQTGLSLSEEIAIAKLAHKLCSPTKVGVEDERSRKIQEALRMAHDKSPQEVFKSPAQNGSDKSGAYFIIENYNPDELDKPLIVERRQGRNLHHSYSDMFIGLPRVSGGPTAKSKQHSKSHNLKQFRYQLKAPPEDCGTTEIADIEKDGQNSLLSENTFQIVMEAMNKIEEVRSASMQILTKSQKLNLHCINECLALRDSKKLQEVSKASDSKDKFEKQEVMRTVGDSSGKSNVKSLALVSEKLLREKRMQKFPNRTPRQLGIPRKPKVANRVQLKAGSLDLKSARQDLPRETGAVVLMSDVTSPNNDTNKDAKMDTSTTVKAVDSVQELFVKQQRIQKQYSMNVPILKVLETSSMDSIMKVDQVIQHRLLEQKDADVEMEEPAVHKKLLLDCLQAIRSLLELKDVAGQAQTINNLLKRCGNCSPDMFPIVEHIRTLIKTQKLNNAIQSTEDKTVITAPEDLTATFSEDISPNSEEVLLNVTYSQTSVSSIDSSDIQDDNSEETKERDDHGVTEQTSTKTCENLHSKLGQEAEGQNVLLISDLLENEQNRIAQIEGNAHKGQVNKKTNKDRNTGTVEKTSIETVEGMHMEKIEEGNVETVEENKIDEEHVSHIKDKVIALTNIIDDKITITYNKNFETLSRKHDTNSDDLRKMNSSEDVSQGTKISKRSSYTHLAKKLIPKSKEASSNSSNSCRLS